MRHGKKFNKLGRTASHRKHMLSNMAASLITHKRINTTVPKAKALRKYVEPLITRSKTDNTHSRRVVFRYLQDKEAVNELFRDVAPKVAERPGGYVRIIRLGNRKGDDAEICMIELVDYNELMLADKQEQQKKSGSGKRRRRRGGKKKSSDQQSQEGGQQTTEASAEQEVADQGASTQQEEEGQTESSGQEGASQASSSEEKSSGSEEGEASASSGESASEDQGQQGSSDEGKDEDQDKGEDDQEKGSSSN